MLYDAQGREISSKRHGMQADAYDIPNGAIVSEEITLAMQNKMRNDAKFRERIELAQKIRHQKFKKPGKLLHLALMQNGEMNAATEAALLANQKFGEKIMRERTKNEKLTESDKAYVQANVV
jgi:hypothetical protein